LGYTVPQNIFFVSFFLFFFFLIRGVRYGFRKYKEATLILMVVTFLPITGAFFISKWRSIYISRQMILFLPFYILLIGLGISSIKKRLFKVITILCILWLTGISIFNYYQNQMPSPFHFHLGTYIKKPYRTAVSFIRDNYEKDDIIAFAHHQFEIPFWHYLGEDYPRYIFSIPDSQERYWNKIFLSFDNVIDLDVDHVPTNKRVWLISGDWPRDRHLDDNSVKVRIWMGEYYKILSERWIDGILIGLYKKV